MYLVLAALASGQRGVPSGPLPGPLPLIAAAVQTLIASPSDFVSAVTITQPVSSPGEAGVIAATVRLLAFEHHLTVEATERNGHLRVRLVRRANQESPDAKQ